MKIEGTMKIENMVLDYQQTGNDLSFAHIMELLLDDIKYLSKKNVPGMDADDVFQELLITLERCASSYDAQKKASFRTYFHNAARRRINDLYRQQTSQKRCLNISAISIYQEQDDDEYELPISDPYNAVDDIEYMLDFLKYSALTEQERVICVLREMGYSNQEISEQLGYESSSRQCYVNRVIGDIRKKFAYA